MGKKEGWSDDSTALGYGDGDKETTESFVGHQRTFDDRGMPVFYMACPIIAAVAISLYLFLGKYLVSQDWPELHLSIYATFGAGPFLLLGLATYGRGKIVEWLKCLGSASQVGAILIIGFLFGLAYFHS